MATRSEGTQEREKDNGGRMDLRLLKESRRRNGRVWKMSAEWM